MRLRKVVHVGPKLVAAVASDGGKCDLMEFLGELSRDYPSEFKGIYDLFKQSSGSRIPARSRHVKSLGDGIFEFKKGDARVLWFEDGGDRLVICSHGFIKKSQETPDVEFDRALDRKKRYFKDKASGKILADWE